MPYTKGKWVLLSLNGGNKTYPRLLVISNKSNREGLNLISNKLPLLKVLVGMENKMKEFDEI